MSHNWNCPDEWEARRQGRWDAERDYGHGWGARNRYECDEANDAYRREYEREQERIAEEHRVERRRQEMRDQARLEEEYYLAQAEEEARQQAEEEAWLEEQYAASADTHPQGGDSAQTEAPFMSGAAPSEETADAQTPSHRR